MKKFLIDLITPDSPISSKRFGGLITLFSAIILAFVAAYKNNGQCPEFMYDGLLLLIAGLFGFNMAENIFKKPTPEIEISDDNTEFDEFEEPSEEDEERAKNKS